MPPRKSSKPGQKSLRQTTLHSFADSSPSRAPASPIKKQTRKVTSPVNQSPLKRKRSTQSFSDNGRESDSDVGAIHSEAEVIELSTEDEGPRSPGKKQRRLATKRVDSAANSRESTIAPMASSSAEEGTDSQMIKPPTRSKGKSRRIKDSDSENEPPPTRRKLVKGIRPPSPEENESDEVDERREPVTPLVSRFIDQINRHY